MASMRKDAGGKAGKQLDGVGINRYRSGSFGEKGFMGQLRD